MENIKSTISLSTAFLVIYIISHHIDVPFAVPMLLFCMSPFVMIWMVIGILKDGIPSDKKFSDGHFYEDYDHENQEFLVRERN